MQLARQKTKQISVDEILDRTNKGYDIYRYYLQKVERQMNRPWGKKEKYPSWGVYMSKNGIWQWTDRAWEESGNAISFVERYFGLTHQEAKDKICWDFGLGQGKQVNAEPVKITWDKPAEEKEYSFIAFSTKPFTDKAKLFWNPAPEDHCHKYDCYQVKDLAVNRRRILIGKDEIVFAYHSPTADGVKIYLPERKDTRFLTNLPHTYLWNYENVSECEDLIIQKSNKDLIITTLLTPCVIATQAEGVKIFTDDVVEKINKICKNPVIFWGSDFDGVKKCKEITDTNKWRYVNTLKALLPKINDAYSLVKANQDDITVLEDFLRHKKVIK